MNRDVRNQKAREVYALNREEVLAKRKDRRVVCPHCPFTFCSTWYLQKHIANRHAEKHTLVQENESGSESVVPVCR